MNAQTFEVALNERPFRPFTLRMANGYAVRVTNPQRVGFSPTSTTAVVVGKDWGFTVIDLPSLTDLDYEPPGPTHNGLR